jgi:programmed cell death protein 5
MDDYSGADIQDIQQLKQIEAMKRQILNQILTKEALERLSRVRMVNPDLAGQVDLYLLQIYQAGRLKNRITDEKLKEILKLLSAKTDFKIRRV